MRVGFVLAEPLYRIEIAVRDELGRDRIVVEYISTSHGDATYEEEAVELASARCAARRLAIVEVLSCVAGAWTANRAPTR